MANTRKTHLLTSVDWAKARAEYELGDSFQTLGARYGRSHAAMSKRARREGWVRDAEVAVRRQVAERAVLGTKVAAGHPEKREAAIAAAVDQRVEIVRRHQGEWTLVRQLIAIAVKDRQSPDPARRATVSAQLKDARSVAAALALAQAGERRAWGITDEKPPEEGDKTIRMVWTDETP